MKNAQELLYADEEDNKRLQETKVATIVPSEVL